MNKSLKGSSLAAVTVGNRWLGVTGLDPVSLERWSQARRAWRARRQPRQVRDMRWDGEESTGGGRNGGWGAWHTFAHLPGRSFQRIQAGRGTGSRWRGRGTGPCSDTAGWRTRRCFSHSARPRSPAGTNIYTRSPGPVTHTHKQCFFLFQQTSELSALTITTTRGRPERFPSFFFFF